MFASTTFASHLPLFNIWAVFRPSVDSGIGSGGKPKVGVCVCRVSCGLVSCVVRVRRHLTV
jgi:hypothetical protein